MTVSDISRRDELPCGVLSLDRLGLGVFGEARPLLRAATRRRRSGETRALKLNTDIAGASFKKTFEELEMVQKLVPIFAKTGGDYSLALDMRTSARLSDVARPANPHRHGRDQVGQISVCRISRRSTRWPRRWNNDDLRKIEAKDVTIRFAIAGRPHHHAALST